jgi:hypothetical protein
MPETTYIEPKGGRKCIICKRENANKRLRTDAGRMRAAQLLRESRHAMRCR